MRDGLFEMVRDAAAGHCDAEMRVAVAHAMLMEAVEFALGYDDTQEVKHVERVQQERGRPRPRSNAHAGRA